MNDITHHQIYWIDRLSMMSVLKLAILLLNLKVNCEVEVRYLEITPRGKKFLDFLVMLSRIKKIRLKGYIHDYDFFQLAGDVESAYDIDHEIDLLQIYVGQYILSKIDISKFRDVCIDSDYPIDKLKLYIKMRAATENRDQIVNLSVMYRLAKSMGDGSDIHLVKKTTFTDPLLKKHSIGRDYCVETYSDPLRILTYLKSITRLIVDLCKTVVRCFVGRVPRNKNNEHVGGRILVSHTQGVDLETRNDIFWYPNSGLDPSRITIYFSRRRFPISKKAIEIIENMGLDWIDLSKWKPGRKDIGYAMGLFQIFINAVKMVFSPIHKIPYYRWWQVQAMLDLNRRVCYWSAFLREQNARIHMHQVANTPSSIPMVFAADKVGAIDVGYQWSATDFFNTSRGRIVSNHLFFSWGHLFSEQLNENGMEPDTVLIGGHVFGYLAKNRRDESNSIRNRLLTKETQFIVCIFDGSMDKDIHQTPKILQEFYRLVVDWMLVRPTIGIIIKPKSDTLLESPEFKNIIDRALTTGRCLIETSNKSSFEVSMASDVALGIGVNTATLDAAIAGIPAIHLDIPGMAVAYEGLQTDSGAYVFRHANKMFSAIDAYRKGLSDNGLGAHGDWLDSIDPFRDGSGASRFGAVLATYLGAIDSGCNVESALNEALRHYSINVGPQYVIDHRNASK